MSVIEKFMKELNEKIRDSLDSELLRKYESESDVYKKIELKNELACKIMPKYIETCIAMLAEMPDEEWDKFCKEIGDQLEPLVLEVGRNALKYRMEVEDRLKVFTEISSMVTTVETVQRAIKELPEEKIKDPKVLERFLVFLYIRLFLLHFILVKHAPLFDIMEIAKTHLGADENWVMATCALDLHENLLKKKLLESGYEEENIQRNVRKRGRKWLEDEVVKIVEEKGKRISLSILQSPGFRKIRNKLEHEGYKYKPTRDEAFEIVGYITRLANELFKAKN